MKDKSLQIRFSRSEIEILIKEAILKEISRVLKKANVDEEIRLAIKEAVIDVDLPGVGAKLLELEERLKKLEAE